MSERMLRRSEGDTDACRQEMAMYRCASLWYYALESRWDWIMQPQTLLNGAI